MKISKWLIVITTVCGLQCRQQESSQTPVARLDNHTLSLQEIRARIDTSREPSQAQVQQYVQRWLTDEILYREAIERGLDRSAEMNKKVDDIRRELSINALLDQEIYSVPLPPENSQELETYYEAHKQEFKLVSDVVMVNLALFSNRDAATEFRNTVLKGMTWNTAVKAKAASILAHFDSTYYTQESLSPIELWRVAANATNHEPSFPINTAQGYYVLSMIKFMKQGQPADLPYIKTEIESRLLIEKRQQAYQRFVQSLRSKHAVEVYINTPSTSGTGSTGE